MIPTIAIAVFAIALFVDFCALKIVQINRKKGK